MKFYWDMSSEGTNFEKELYVQSSAKRIVIVSAYLSKSGIDLIRSLANHYELKGDQVFVILSSEFSTETPSTFLTELKEIATVRIVFNKKLHSKLYLIDCDEPILAFGSSNLTAAGFKHNVEFDAVYLPNKTEMNSINQFITFCTENSVIVDEEVIEFYKQNEYDYAELNKLQKKTKDFAEEFYKQFDDFSPEDCDLSDHFFSYEDYEAFFSRNAKKIGAEIQKKRKAVQAKLLEIHNDIYSEIQSLGIYCHKNEDYITSLITPCEYNRGSVDWLAVRYGKSQEEVDCINIDANKEDVYGFQKHSCLQFSMHASGFEIALFFAVRTDSFDRAWLSEENYKKLKERRSEIEEELRIIKGNGFVWLITNGEDDFTYRIDDEPIEVFCDWFMEHDKSGYESLLTKSFHPDSSVLISKDSIEAEILGTAKLLLPLYNLLIWRPKK